MEIKKVNDVIYSEDVLEIFEGRLSYGTLLGLIREKRLPALKAGKRYLFSRKVVERFKAKQLGLS